jgi:cell division protein FtsZ
MKGARGVLINITGGPDMTLFEVDEAANRIRDEVDPEANIIFGSTFDQSLDAEIRISVIATGIEAEASAQPKAPRVISLVGNTRDAKPALRPAPSPAMASAIAAVQHATAAQPISHGATALQHHREEPAAAPVVAPRMEVPQPVPPARPPQPEAKAAPVEAPAPVAAPAPAAMPAAKAPDAFVPPPSVEVRSSTRIQPQQRPNPMNEAALVNGGQPPAKARRWSSILEIVASSSRRASREADPVMSRAQAPAPQPSVAAPAAPPASTPEASLPLPEPAHPEPKLPETKQAELGGLESPPVAHKGPSDDELLDIPAFLRRQAN